MGGEETKSQMGLVASRSQSLFTVIVDNNGNKGKGPGGGLGPGGAPGGGGGGGLGPLPPD